MPHPLTMAMRGSVLAVVLASWAAPAIGQAPYAPPRTPWGHPDLQGVWTSDDARTVPVQRPPELGEKAALTDAEFAARKRRDDERMAALATGVNPRLPRSWEDRSLFERCISRGPLAPRDPSCGRPQ